MRVRRHDASVRIACGVALCFLASLPLGAQDSTSNDASSPSFWLSAGLGAGSAGRTGGLLALQGSAWLANGPFVGGVRASLASGLEYGDYADEGALLAGARTSRGPFSLIGALGYSALSIRCEDSPCPGVSSARQGALAYSLQAHASLKVIGVGVELYGASGEGMRRLSGVVGTVQLGWFP